MGSFFHGPGKLFSASRTRRHGHCSICRAGARHRTAEKRGGSADDLLLKEQLIPDERVQLVLELDDALRRLAKSHERQSKAMELYYFGGLTLEEAAAVLGTSAATVMRDIRFAKAWLARAWGR